MGQLVHQVVSKIPNIMLVNAENYPGLFFLIGRSDQLIATEVQVQHIVNNADHPWWKGDDRICFQLSDEVLNEHKELKKVLGGSGHFFIEAGTIMANGQFVGKLNTVNEDDSVTSDGKFVVKLSSDKKFYEIMIVPEVKDYGPLTATVAISDV